MSVPAESRRVKMTKTILRDSLIELMKDKSIHIITVKEICENADINRSTFYRHYDSQYELYRDIIDNITGDFNDIFENTKREGLEVAQLLTRLFEYIESNREVFLVVLSDKGNINVGEAYFKIIERFVKPENSSELGTYILQFISAGMTSFIWSWISQEERRKPAEMASIFIGIIRHGISRALDFSKLDFS